MSFIVTNPDTPTRNIIQPVTGNVEALTLRESAAGQTVDLFQAQGPSGNLQAGIQPGGGGYFIPGSSDDAVISQIDTALGLNAALTLGGQTGGFCALNVFGETVATRFNNILIFGGYQPLAASGSRAQPAFQFGVDGNITAAGVLTNYQFTIADYNAPGNAIAIQGNADSKVNIGGSSPYVYDGQLSVFPHSAAIKGITIRPKAAATANQQEWQDSTGAAQMAVGPDGRSFIFDTTGTKFGTATTQKLAFFNAAPVAQQTGASAAGIAAITDANAKAAVSALQTALANLGLVTSPA